MSPQIEKVTTEQLVLGEGPHWDVQTKKLYFVDLLQSTVHCYDPASGKHTWALVDSGKKPVSLIVPVENETNKFLVTYGCDIATIKWDGLSKAVSDFTILCTVDDRYPELRINDGKCSPSGVLFAGTMFTEFEQKPIELSEGSLYALREGSLKNILKKDVKLSNGLAWTQDEKRFYYNDSLLYRVDCFDYDRQSNALSNRRTVFDFKAKNISGIPDGMTIDTDGNLWVANFFGSQVLKINPNDGTLLDTVKIPTSRVTSVVFGGPNLDELYVTSASKSTAEDKDPSDDNAAGCVFRVKGLSARGLPSIPVKL